MPGVNPLEGVTVVEAASYVAGPHAGLILSDWGADVIKIEPPGGDATRRASPNIGGVTSPYFENSNRNKRSLCIDLRTEAGLAAMRRVLASSDVLLTGFRPSVASRLGLTFSQLQAENPKLVVANLSGFGSDPIAESLPGYDWLAQARSGLAFMVSDDGGPPRIIRLSMLDVVTGINAAFLVMGALMQRATTGHGQQIDVAIIDTAISMLGYHFANFGTFGITPERPAPSAHPNWVPCQVFRTADGHLLLTVLATHHFRSLCEALGLTTLLEEPGSESPTYRAEHRDMIVEALQSVLVRQSTETWLELLTPMGIPCSPINDLDQMLTDPLVAGRDPARTMTTSAGDPVVVLRNQYLLANMREDYRAAPLPGEHNGEILRELAGLSSAEIDRLRTEQVIHDYAEPPAG